MNKKLPKIFQNDGARVVTNNEKVYYSMYQDLPKSLDRKEDVDVLEEIKLFFHSNKYVYTKDVLVETKDRVYETRLAKLGDDYLLTLDNEKIPLSSILSFKIKSRF